MPRQVIIAVAVLLLTLLGLGIYAFRLKQHAERLQHSATDSRPISPPLAGPAETITLMVAIDSDGTIQRASDSLPLPAERSERARRIIRALLDYYAKPGSSHTIPDRSDVNAVYIVSDNIAVIDMNAAFADNHPSGVLVEELSIASIAQTLAANLPNVTRVKILIDGKERDTLAGHADLRTIYDVSALRAFATT